MADIIPVLGNDTLDNGRQKFNEAIANINQECSDNIAALIQHEGSGDHDGRYYTQTLVDGIATQLSNAIAAANALLTTHKTSSDHDSRYYTQALVDGFVATLNGLITTANGSLTTHKASGDHDARYILASALSTLIQTTGTQTIGGSKTFTSSPTIKNSSGELIFTDGSDQPTMKLSAVGYGGGVVGVRIYVNSLSTGTAWVNVFEATGSGTDSGKILLPARDVYAGANRLATELYVQARIRSGTFGIPFVIDTGTIAANTTYGPTLLVPPPGAILKDATTMVHNDSLSSANTENAAYSGMPITPYLFPTDGSRWLEVRALSGPSDGGLLSPTLELKSNNGSSVVTIGTFVAGSIMASTANSHVRGTILFSI